MQFCKELNEKIALRKIINKQANPNVDNDLLILVASFKRSPSAPELFCLNIYLNSNRNKQNQKKKKERTLH